MRFLIRRIWLEIRDFCLPRIRRTMYFWKLFEALRFKEFEAEKFSDYLVIPFFVFRFFLAWGWTYARAVPRYFKRRKEKNIRWHLFGYGRHDSPEPEICPRCLWAGMQRSLVHCYNEYEGYDECPRCGNEV